LKYYNKNKYDNTKEFENYQLIGVIKDLSHKKAKSFLIIKEHIHYLKKGKIEFQVLETKFQKYIKLKK